MEINKDYRIIDNFLDKNIFLNIKNIMENDEFPWFFVKQINENHDINDLTSYFVHMFFLESNENSRISNYFNLIVPILTKINMLKLIRIKGNVYQNTKTKIIHEKHVDYNYPHKGAIYYINTNNGKTILNNNLEIDSIENRLLIFNPNIPHSSTSTTDSKFRMNINFNYI
jgi:hypothetical protein